MTSRERILAVLHGAIPDCVPCCPDISNMVPARLTGKPFWDIYVHQNPPLWKAYIEAAKYFDTDAGFEVYSFGNLFGDQSEWEPRIVKRNSDGGFVTRNYSETLGKWEPYVQVHTMDNPPAYYVAPEKVGLSAEPGDWEPVMNVKQWPVGMELWSLIRKEMGEQGVLGMPSGMTTCLLKTENDIYDYYDNPGEYHERAERMLETVKERMKVIDGLSDKPDFLFCGGSGSLVTQSPDIFRELILPALKETTRLAAERGIPTHVHSCGPEKELVRMAVQETGLTVIDPLEIRPMGDCDLAELKREFAGKIVLKGNLHTTNVMLKGSVDDVVRESRCAIAAAAVGGGFILSTGDQCGRDTPDANLFAMTETARKYGRYRADGGLLEN